MTRNYIFDLDGTLVDSLPGIEYAIDEALSRLGRRRHVRDVRTLIGPSIRSILQTITGTTDDDELNALESYFRRYYDAEGWRKTVCYSGVCDTLQALHAQGKRLFVVTNKPRYATEKILNLFGIRAYLEDVLTLDSKLPPFRNKSEMLRYIIAGRELAADESLMIGDTVEDCMAAAEAGLPAAIVMYGYGYTRLAEAELDFRTIAEFGQIAVEYLRGAA